MGKVKKKYGTLNRQQKRFILRKLGIKDITEIDTALLIKLKEDLKKLKDKRMKKKIVYKLWDIIMCVIIASFAFNNTWEEIEQFVEDHYDWFRSFLKMTGGIPKAITYERVMGIIDSSELNSILLEFFETLIANKDTSHNYLNLDGRVNNGSKRKATMFSEEKKPLNVLNGYSSKNNYCIFSIPIDEKTNEIPAIEDLIKGLNLEGISVTFDALNTQTSNIKAIIKAGGDYYAPIKANQGNFYNDLIDYFDEKKCDEIIAGNTQSQYLTIKEKSHSAIITYECFQTSDVDWYSKKEDWQGLKSIGLIRKTTKKMVQKTIEKETKTGKIKKEKIMVEEISIENRYYISNKYPDVNEFYEITRMHWNVENKIHWHLDYTFLQDKNTTTNKQALLNLEIIHKFILSVLDRVKTYYGKSLVLIRKHLSNNIEEYFPELLTYLLLT